MSPSVEKSPVGSTITLPFEVTRTPYKSPKRLYVDPVIRDLPDRGAHTFTAQQRRLSEIAKAPTNAIRAQAVEGFVKDSLRKGSPDRLLIVSTLITANAAELALPHMREPFVETQYQKALAEGKAFDAHRIALLMIDKRDAIVASKDPEPVRNREERNVSLKRWAVKEREAFEQRGDAVLRAMQQKPTPLHALDLRNYYEELRMRPDIGFRAEPLHPLTLWTAREMLNYDMTSGNFQEALVHIADMRVSPDLSNDYFTQLLLNTIPQDEHKLYEARTTARPR